MEMKRKVSAILGAAVLGLVLGNAFIPEESDISDVSVENLETDQTKRLQEMPIEKPATDVSERFANVLAGTDVINYEEPPPTFLTMASQSPPTDSFELTLPQPIFKAINVMEPTFTTRKMVKEILVYPGKTVGEGELLAVQDTEDLEAELAAKEAELKGALYSLENPNKIESAKYDVGHTADILGRFKELRKSGSASVTELGKALRDHTQAKYTYGDLLYQKSTAEIMIPKLEAEIRSLKARIRERKIYAPFSGEIGEVEVEPGQVVETQKILKLFDLSKVEGICEVSNELKLQYPWWRTATPIVHTQKASFEGKISHIDESVGGPAVTIRLIFENSQDQDGNWIIKPTEIVKLTMEKKQSPETLARFNK